MCLLFFASKPCLPICSCSTLLNGTAYLPYPTLPLFLRSAQTKKRSENLSTVFFSTIAFHIRNVKELLSYHVMSRTNVSIVSEVYLAPVGRTESGDTQVPTLQVTHLRLQLSELSVR